MNIKLKKKKKTRIYFEKETDNSLTTKFKWQVKIKQDCSKERSEASVCILYSSVMERQISNYDRQTAGQTHYGEVISVSVCLGKEHKNVVSENISVFLCCFVFQ